MNDILDNLVEYAEDSTRISNENATAQIYMEDDTNKADEMAEGKCLSTILLGDCSDILHSVYNLPDDEQLILLKIDLNRTESATNAVDYYIFDSKGNVLDLSYCNNIELVIPIINLEESILNLSESYSQQGIDVFNSSDSFFNDRCYPYSDSENDTDIPVSSRREDIFKNVSFCSNDCTYNGIDHDSLTVKCRCDTQNTDTTIQSTITHDKSKITSSELVSEFTSSLTSTNLLVVTCINLIFNFKSMRTNLGCIILFAILVTEILVFLYAVCQGTRPIEEFLNKFIAGSPPKKSNYQDPEIKITKPKKKQTGYSINSCSTFAGLSNKRKKNNIKRKFDLNSRISDEPEKMSSENNETNNDYCETVNSLHNKPITIVVPFRKRSQKRLKSTFNTEKPITDEEINELSYEEAVEMDHRNFCQLYWGYLQEEEVLLNTFIKSYFVELKSIRIILFFTSIAIDFALNALFYTDSLIETKYKNGGTLDFLLSIPKSLYSFAIGFVIGFMLQWLSSSKSNLITLMKHEKNKFEFKRMSQAILRKLRHKLVFYFIINFILMMFFWYYVTAFCAVYHSTQISWLTGGLTSFGISLLIPFLICIIFASMRILSLRYKKRTLYLLVKFLNSII